MARNDVDLDSLTSVGSDWSADVKIGVALKVIKIFEHLVADLEELDDHFLVLAAGYDPRITSKRVHLEARDGGFLDLFGSVLEEPAPVSKAVAERAVDGYKMVIH